MKDRPSGEIDGRSSPQGAGGRRSAVGGRSAWGVWKVDASGRGDWLAYGYDRVRCEWHCRVDAEREAYMLSLACLSGARYEPRPMGSASTAFGLQPPASSPEARRERRRGGTTAGATRRG